VIFLSSAGSNELPLGVSTARSQDITAQSERDRSPVDLLLLPDESRIVTANQTANSITLLDVSDGKIVAEAKCGVRPTSLAITADGQRVLATATFSGELFVYSLSEDRLEQVGKVVLGFEPRGVVISPDGKTAYVALSTAASVAVIDIDRCEVIDRIAVGRWPRYLAISPDGKRLAAGCNGDGGVSVVDTLARKQLYLEDFLGLNLGQMQVSNDGLYVYFPWIVYRQNPITAENIRRGWVLASRIARVRLDGPARREAIALDPRGEAVGDPHGLALSPDEKTMVCTGSGTHELLIFRLPGLPFQDYGGPGDHIDDELLADKNRFERIALGGRPMAARFSKSGDKVYVANYLQNSVQVVDMVHRRVERTIRLNPSIETTLVRRGESIFYDAARSLDQWYSCHSCHYEGHTNAITMDTRNDGRFRNFKTVLTLRGAAETKPWFWHGWAGDLETALRRSMTGTMLGKEPSNEDVSALAAFIKTLTLPANSNRDGGQLSESATRGEMIFQGTKASCAHCHPAPLFTDGAIHDVGLGSANDAYEGYNTPSLRGIYDRTHFLHDGRARTLEEVLSGPHNPASVTGMGELSDAEMQDLLAYLKSL